MEPVRCSATTAAGTPCRGWAMHGAEFCGAHLGRNGRKTLLTEPLTENLVTLLRGGNYIEVACRAVGLSRRTFGEWMTRGKSGLREDDLYADFRARIEEACALGEARLVASIASAARENWAAAGWLLERQYPDRWGRVSVRLRELEPIEPSAAVADDDPFAEVDQLAERRRQRSG